MDDYALMEAIASGDESALGQLYDRYSPALLAVCVRIVGDRNEAEDVVVDVFYELWNRSERYEAFRGTPLSYLMTVTRSRALDRRRSRGRHPEVGLEAAEPFITSPHDAHTPAVDAALHERRARIVRALAALPADKRRAVELSFFDGLSHREIADAMKLPLGTVKSHIRLGLIQLRDGLRTLYDAESDST